MGLLYYTVLGLVTFLSLKSVPKCEAQLKLLSQTKLNGTIPVAKYVSQKTGLKIILVDIEGPTVNGYYFLGTEAHDDDGLPHALEHLVFLGSEDYPYKGALDLIANLCFSDGLNAWTDVDHTAYTCSNAGKEGFLTLLPVYLDHILYAQLKNSGFVTEVYNINGDGQDGGVVYSEMQGATSGEEYETKLGLLRSIYNNSDYSSETGGLLENLRTSTTNQKIRDYYAKFYRPENLYLIICGQVNIKEVEKALAAFERKIVSKPRKLKFEKPWQTPIPKFSNSVDLKILYSSNREDAGLINVGWRGPHCIKEFQKLISCKVLLTYLCSTSLSPLQKDFVEIEDAFASDITFKIEENPSSLMYISFHNVPLNKTELIYPKLHTILTKIAKGIKIDMVRMKDVIEREMLTYFSDLEKHPHQTIATKIIKYELYGNTNKEFESILNLQKTFEHLLTVNNCYWIKILKKYFVDVNYVNAMGIPSIAKQEQSIEAEETRIQQRVIQLGPDGLAQKGKEVAEANKENSIPPPTAVLNKVKSPSLGNFAYHQLKTYRTGDKTAMPDGFNINNVPIYLEANDCRTNFVYLTATLNTQSVTAKLRPYLLLFLNLIRASPIRKGQDLIPYETVVRQLQDDTIDYTTCMGLDCEIPFKCGIFSQTIAITIIVEQTKYNKGVQWLIDLLYNTEFVIERIKSTTFRLLADAVDAENDEENVARSLILALFYKDDTNVKLSSMKSQQKFLTSVQNDLNGTGAQNGIKNLNDLRKILTAKDNLAAYVTADWAKLKAVTIDLEGPWLPLANTSDQNENLEKKLTAVNDWECIKSNENIPVQGEVVGLPTTESSFLFQATPAIKNYADDDLAALSVFCTYFSQIEGPMWRRIRGPGYTYGYTFDPSPNEGLLYFSLYRATDVVAALKEFRKMLNEILAPDAIWDEFFVNAAKHSLISITVNEEKNIGDLHKHSILLSFKQLNPEYKHEFVKKIDAVTIDQLKAVGQKYVSKLLTNEAKTMILCNSEKADAIAAQLLSRSIPSPKLGLVIAVVYTNHSEKCSGINLTVRLSLEESLLGQGKTEDKP